MRKLILAIGLLLLSSNVYADVISVPAFSADSGVDHLNTFRTTVVNVINGSIQGAGSTAAARNVGSDSIAEIDMYDDANPRIFANELLSIGSDSFASGSLTQNTFVDDGLVPATDTDLTSDISAGTAYINGYRVDKSATSKTYTASMDTYVDLSQAGVFTYSEVAVGATQPAVAANSVRLARVTTNGSQITAVTTYPTGRIPGLVIPAQYRTGLIVSRDSTTTITVLPGTSEINNSMVSKTASSTLTISTAGDWAGGTSLRAASTYGYVGCDSSGNLKLHTTAPTHDNYAVSTTVGKRRYATWSSTVYRILGWFYMDGAQLVEVASNIKEGDVANRIFSNDSATLALSSTSLTEVSKLPFYSSGGTITLQSVVSGDAAGSLDEFSTEIFRSGSSVANSGAAQSTGAAGKNMTTNSVFMDANRPQGTATYSNYSKVSGSSVNVRRRGLLISEE